MNIENPSPSSLPVFEKLAQKEAILNELKGALFEFLLARELAQKLAVEEAFYQTLAPADQAQLEAYQRYLFTADPELYQELPKLAQKGVEKLVGELPLGSRPKIYLTGRQRAYDSLKLAESDLLLHWPCGKRLSLSVKLCKEKSFVNTKSGGAKSFLAKYFHHSQAPERQQIFNQHMDQRYYELRGELGLSEEELPPLPGDLAPELKEVLQAYYFDLIQEIYTHLRFFHQEDPALFLRDLAPLCGVTQEDLWQLICFHKQQGEKRYQLSSLELLKGEELAQKLGDFTWQAPKKNHASCALSFAHFDLQIRIKPMNKFATASYKINCSLRFRAL